MGVKGEKEAKSIRETKDFRGVNRERTRGNSCLAASTLCTLHCAFLLSFFSYPNAWRPPCPVTVIS